MLKSMLTCTDRESWIERHRYLNSPTSLSCSPQCIMEKGLHFCSRGCCELKGNFSTYQCTPSCFSETSRYRFCKSDKKEKRLTLRCSRVSLLHKFLLLVTRKRSAEERRNGPHRKERVGVRREIHSGSNGEISVSHLCTSQDTSRKCVPLLPPPPCLAQWHQRRGKREERQCMRSNCTPSIPRGSLDKMAGML